MTDQNRSDYTDIYAAKCAAFEGRPAKQQLGYREVALPAAAAPKDSSFEAPADAHPSSVAFYAVLAEAAKLHDKKQRDYGSDADPFANVRASEDFGIPAWLGCIIRGNDKVRRIQSFATRGELANESIEDALIDLLVYSGIALVLYRETL